MEVSAYLYDASGKDDRVELTDDICDRLNDKKMLWVDVSRRERETVERVAKALKLKNLPLAPLIKTRERPRLDKYEKFYHFFITSVDESEKENLKPIAIDFVVGDNLS